VQPTDPRPTLGELLWEVIDLTGGLTIILLPLFLLGLPGFVLFILAPAALVLAPLALAGAVVAPPYLLIRAIRRRLHPPSPRAG
jgi:hypothetical protein